VALGTLHQKDDAPAASKKQKYSDSFFKKYPHLFIVFTGIAFAAMGSSLIANYLIAIIEGVGGDSGTMGFMQALAAYLEIPAMFGFAWAAKRFGVHRLLTVSVIFSAIKSILLTTATSVEMVFVATLMQLLGWGLYIPASVEYAKISTAPEDQVRAQGVFSSFTMVSSILANFCGGMIVQYFGVSVLTYTAVTVGVIGAVMVLIFGRVRKEQQNGNAANFICDQPESQAGEQHPDGDLSGLSVLDHGTEQQEESFGDPADPDLGQDQQQDSQTDAEKNADEGCHADVCIGADSQAAGGDHSADGAAAANSDNRTIQNRAAAERNVYLSTSGVPNMRTRKLRLSGLLRRIQKSTQKLR